MKKSVKLLLLSGLFLSCVPLMTTADKSPYSWHKYGFLAGAAWGVKELGKAPKSISDILFLGVFGLIGSFWGFASEVSLMEKSYYKMRKESEENIAPVESPTRNTAENRINFDDYRLHQYEWENAMQEARKTAFCKTRDVAPAA